MRIDGFLSGSLCRENSTFCGNVEDIVHSHSSDSLISSENVPSVYLSLHVVKAGVIAICYDGVALGLELGNVIDYLRTEECGAVFEGRFIDYNLGTFGFDAFHYALDGALTEVVGV